MKKIIFLLLFPVILHAQGDQTIITVPAGGSATQKAILHLPDDYQTTSATYPLMVFLHGAGEAGTNPASIYGSSSAGGPAYYISSLKWPSSFTNPADGKAYKYIVVSPQSVASNSSTSAASLDVILSYLVKTYRIDVTRIYLTGLSMGGASLFQYVNNEGVTATFTPAATIPMSMAVGTPNNTEVAAHLKKNVNVWAFGSETDVYGIMTHLFVVGSYGGNNGPTPPALGKNGRFSAYSGGHCCWGPLYDPNYRETINGKAMNIYEWALQFQQGAVIAPPVVVTFSNAAASKSFTRICGLGSTGSSVTYAVAAGKYKSTVSQVNADSLASADITANGQAFANTNGACSVVQRTVTGIQIMINGQLIAIPLTGAKITYSDGSTQ